MSACPTCGCRCRTSQPLTREVAQRLVAELKPLDFVLASDAGPGGHPIASSFRHDMDVEAPADVLVQRVREAVEGKRWAR